MKFRAIMEHPSTFMPEVVLVSITPTDLVPLGCPSRSRSRSRNKVLGKMGPFSYSRASFSPPFTLLLIVRIKTMLKHNIVIWTLHSHIFHSTIHYDSYIMNVIQQPCALGAHCIQCATLWSYALHTMGNSFAHLYNEQSLLLIVYNEQDMLLIVHNAQIVQNGYDRYKNHLLLEIHLNTNKLNWTRITRQGDSRESF